MQTVDFASPHFESVGAERAVAMGTGIPLYIAPNIAGLVLGWFEGVLRSSGAEAAVGEFSDVVVQSRPDGYDSVSMRFDFRWRLDRGRMSQSRSSSRLAAVITSRLTKAK
jgi:hypothetical protein